MNANLPDLIFNNRMPSLRVTAVCCAILTMFMSASGQAKQPERQSGPVLVDYMVATVNGDLINYSDVVWQLAVQPNTPIDPARPEDLKKALSLLIDQRLILQDARKLPQIHGEDAEVEAGLNELVRHFSSEAELRQRMTRVGLTSERLREIVHERVDIEKYLDFRFRAFVVVTSKEVEAYYRDTYAGRLRARSPGAILPKLEQARPEIERILTEEKIETGIQGFLDEARQPAEIVILRPIA